jgi:hypothetical protein
METRANYALIGFFTLAVIGQPVRATRSSICS